MEANEKKAAIRRLLKERYFYTQREAEKVKKILINEFPRTMFSFRVDWEAKCPELNAEMILEVINT